MCDLATPLGCLAFYNFYCNLHAHNTLIITPDSEQNFKGLANTLKMHQWRAPSPERKRQNPWANPNPSKRSKSNNSATKWPKDGLESDRLSVGSVSDEEECPVLDSEFEDETKGGEDLKVTRATCRRSLSWIAEHIKPLDMTTRWIDCHSERCIFTEEDFGMVMPILG